MSNLTDFGKPAHDNLKRDHEEEKYQLADSKVLFPHEQNIEKITYRMVFAWLWDYDMGNVGCVLLCEKHSWSTRLY